MAGGRAPARRRAAGGARGARGRHAQVYDELRRRLGGPFTTEELVALYDEGTGWISDLAVAAAPDAPFAWDVRIVGDAAFARYVRRRGRLDCSAR